MLKYLSWTKRARKTQNPAGLKRVFSSRKTQNRELRCSMTETQQAGRATTPTQAGSTTTGILVIPNQQELAAVKKLKLSRAYSSPLAVMNLKVTRSNLARLATSGLEMQVSFSAIAQEYPNHEFMLHIQTAEGVTFDQHQLAAIDVAQDIKETSHFLIYQEGADASLADFTKRLDHADKSFKHKKRLPVLDPAATSPQALQQKCQEIVKREYGEVVIIFRNPRNNLAGWQTIQAALQQYGIKMYSVNVNRRAIDALDAKGHDVRASTLLLPVLFGCSGMTHYFPWAGGKSDLRFMSADMHYELAKNAGRGLWTDTNGLDRQTILKTFKKDVDQRELARVDAILQTQELFKTVNPLASKPQIRAVASRIDAVRHFAQEFGLI